MGLFDSLKSKRSVCPTLHISNQTKRTALVTIDGKETEVKENGEEDFSIPPEKRGNPFPMVKIELEGTANFTSLLDESNYRECGCHYAVMVGPTAGEFQLVRDAREGAADACTLEVLEPPRGRLEESQSMPTIRAKPVVSWTKGKGSQSSKK